MDDEIIRQFVERLSRSRLELRLVETELDLLRARREALIGFIAAAEAIVEPPPAQVPRRPREKPAKPPAPSPTITLDEAILAVLSEASAPLKSAEIGREARAVLGAKTLDRTPGHILERLKKQGQVERVGYRWQLAGKSVETADAQTTRGRAKSGRRSR